MSPRRTGHRPIGQYRRSSQARVSFRLISTSALVALVVLSAAANADPCLPDCALGSGQDLQELQQACDDYANRADNRQTRFDECMTHCQKVAARPELAGHCALTRDCLAECRVARLLQSNASLAHLSKDIRVACSTGKPRCTVSRRLARRLCKDFLAPPTTTAVTFPPVDGTTAALASEGSTASTTTPMTGLPQQEAGEEDNGCRPRCVSHVLRFCSADCADACEGDQTAFKFCLGGCRNRHCALLVSFCKCVEGDICEIITTTTTSTTATTSTTTTSTTTTLVAG